MAWSALLVILLGVIYIVIPLVCEPRTKGHSKSLALPFIPFSFGLAYLTLRGFWMGNCWMMILPPAFVAALSLHTLWMFRASWKDKLWRNNAMAKTQQADAPDRNVPGD